jgi:hypothetical protein
VAYGRRITGRLALQLSAGPEISRSTLAAGGNSTVVSWNLLSSLRYQLRPFDLDVSYNHYTTSGAGILYGASSDNLLATANRRLTREWTGSLIAGYSRNNAYQQLTVPVTIPSGFRSLFGGVTANRSLGRYASLLFNYSIQRQYNGSCAGGACAPTFLRHVFGVGVSWNFRPIGLD